MTMQRNKTAPKADFTQRKSTGVAPTHIPKMLRITCLSTLSLLVLSSCVLLGFDRVKERDGRRWLFGGNEPGQAFDITEFRLDPKQLNFGLGREAFHALISPEFGRPGDREVGINDRTRVLGVVINGEAKAFPIHLLRGHEVVNDTVGGRPIFAAYCILADLAGVYDREMAGHVYTFAVSGYTYADKDIWNGLNAFVLWDRDTESLWLPTIGKGVSGAMIDVPMQLTPEELWSDTTWGEFRREHPDAVVMKSGQRLKVRPEIPRYKGPFPEKVAVDPRQSIAPRGEK